MYLLVTSASGLDCTKLRPRVEASSDTYKHSTFKPLKYAKDIKKIFINLLTFSLGNENITFDVFHLGVF